MTLASKLYNLCLPSERNRGIFGKSISRVASYARRYALKITDPLCELKIHGTALYIPLSHPLPLYHAAHPQCDAVLGRIADWMRGQGETITYVDIGANIGDTIAAIHPRNGEHVIAVEPFAPYAAVLRKNLSRFSCTAEIIEKACVQQSGPDPLSIQGSQGTGVLTQDAGGNIVTTTLDDLMADNAGIVRCNFLKIDVDGHDFSVLKGGMAFLSKCRPNILMESDIFSNEEYLEDFLALVQQLYNAGYRHMLAYDNYGGLIYSSALDQVTCILPVLFYQASRGRIYLDLLFGTDLRDFHKSELEFFSNLTPNPIRKTVARRVAEQIHL